MQPFPPGKSDSNGDNDINKAMLSVAQDSAGVDRRAVDFRVPTVRRRPGDRVRGRTELSGRHDAIADQALPVDPRPRKHTEAPLPTP